MYLYSMLPVAASKLSGAWAKNILGDVALHGFTNGLRAVARDIEGRTKSTEQHPNDL